MAIKTSARRYGYGRFRKVPMAPMPAVTREGKLTTAWRRYFDAHTRLVPTIAPGDVLREGVWAGTTAREALEDDEFAEWLLNYPNAMSGEARGLLHLLLRTRVQQMEARRRQIKAQRAARVIQRYAMRHIYVPRENKPAPFAEAACAVVYSALSGAV